MPLNSMINDTMIFACQAHRHQKRKYTNLPYRSHLSDVFEIVQSFNRKDSEESTVIACTAWLHDCIEDAGITHQTLSIQFGKSIADAVLMLSDLETGTRKERKAASCIRQSAGNSVVHDVKCADIISNSTDIARHDPVFAKTYLPEKFLH